MYPLLTFLANGLDVDLQTISLLITVQVGATLFSPLGGMLADTRGERTIMQFGLLLFSIGGVVCAFSTSFAPFLAGYALAGLGTAFYNPAAHAYASNHTPYAYRGRILGILELSWALAALVGVTSLSALIERSNAWAPAFWVLAGAGMLMLLATRYGLLAAQPVNAAHTAAPGLRVDVLHNPNVVAWLLVVFCAMGGYEMVYVVYSSWLETDFNATLAQVGLVFGSLGFVEFGGSIGAAVLADWFGKRRVVLLGLITAALLQFAIPLSSGNWLAFLPTFLLLGLVAEFSIVAAIIFTSGLITGARGTVIALGVTAMGMGRVAGSLIGPRIFEAGGFLFNGLAAGMLSLAAVLLCLLLVREGEDAQPTSTGLDAPLQPGGVAPGD
ncbi:MAG: MFS transporter [Chloroflexaceae bacterium]|nr:MFS transporter [Chloroflexaceae bacterium]